MIYTVADEQNYHFQVLFLILKKLGHQWAKNCHHLSYGMVTLPSGKMKSREGTVVDADDLMDQMERTAEKLRKEKRANRDDLEKELDTTIGMAALKFHILKVDPKYTHARIKSILKKYGESPKFPKKFSLLEKERTLIKKSIDYQDQIKAAANSLNPSILANYLYGLVKLYNTYYQETPILQEKDQNTAKFRIALSAHIALIIKKSANLLGFEVPESM